MLFPRLVADHPYIDALPRFHIARLEARYRRGQNHIVWYDQDHAPVALGIVKSLINDRLTIEYTTDETGYISPVCGVMRFDLRFEARGRCGHFATIVCAKCRDPKTTMILFEEWWRCAKCSHIVSRSSRLSSSQRKWLAIEELQRIAAAPRPHAMRYARYDQICAEYDRRRGAWGSRPPHTLTQTYTPYLTTRYFTADAYPGPDEPETPMGASKPPQRAG